MGPFCIEIAGVRIRVAPLFESTRHYCKHYLTEREPEHFVTVTREDLAQEQQLLREEAHREGLRPRVFQEPFLERSVIQRRVAEALLSRQILLVHGSAVAVDEKAYLFTAACGTGKSTHTRLWRQVFGSRAVMVNDDKPFLKITESEILVCGSPWSGKHGLDTNVALPLQGICILERGAENRIRPMEAEAALPLLEGYWDLTCHPAGKPLAAKICQRVPLWRMECNREEEAAVIAHRAMGKNS